MTLRQIHKSFVTGHTSLIVVVFLFILFRFIGANEGDSAVVLWSTAAVQLATAFLLLYLTQTFVIIRNRTFLSAFFYLLFTGTIPDLYGDLSGSFSGICLLFCNFFLFASYQQERSQAHALNIALFLTIGSFLWAPLLYFFPLFWFGMYQLRSLNFRSFVASLLGFVVVYLFVFTWNFHQGTQATFLQENPDWQALLHINPLDFDLLEYLIIGFLAMLFFLSGGNIFVASISEKIKTIIALRFLYIACVFVFILLLLQNDWKKEWFSILCIPLSLLVTHLFALTEKTVIRWLMLATILFFLVMFILFQLEMEFDQSIRLMINLP